MTFIVRPMGETRDDSEFQGVVVSRIRRAFDGRLAQDNNSERARIRKFSEVADDGLFEGAVFTEFRFGTTEWDANGSPILGDIARSMAKAAKAQKVPIAYLQFPHWWRTFEKLQSGIAESVGGLRWLRMAFGVPFELGAVTQLYLAARDIAAKTGSAFAAYDPLIEQDFMGKRFRVEEDLLPRTRDRNLFGADVELSNSLLYVEGTARHGLVSDVLEYTFDREIVGGSMTVLQNHTVSSWVPAAHVRQERLRALKNEIGSGLCDDPAQALGIAALDSAYLAKRATSLQLAGPNAEWDSFWVVWRSGDAPGVIAAVTEELLFQGLSEARVLYLVSRVIKDGPTCAGKLKIVAKRGAVRSVLRRSFIVERRIRRRLEFASRDWHPASADWTANPVEIARSEPAEEPWSAIDFARA